MHAHTHEQPCGFAGRGERRRAHLQVNETGLVIKKNEEKERKISVKAVFGGAGEGKTFHPGVSETERIRRT